MKTLLKLLPLTTAIACGLLWPRQTAAQTVSYTGGTLTENFDSMGTNGTNTPLGWFVGYAGPTNLTAVAVSDGGNAPDGTAGWNFGTIGAADRALGTMSTSTGSPAPNDSRYVEVRIRNNSGQNISAILLTYDGEQWRSGSSAAVVTRLTPRYSADGVNFTDLGTAFNFTQPTLSPTSVALDGNANRVVGIGGIYTLPAPAPPAATLFLRWFDANDANTTDPALAIDNVSFSAATPQAVGIGIATPANGQSFLVGDNATVTTTNSGSIASVAFFVDGEQRLLDSSAPYEFILANLTAGSHILRAIAAGNGGVNATSAPVTITVTDSPGVTVLVANGATWKYLDNGSDQGSAWQAPEFDDSAWSSGPAELGFGDSTDNPPRPERTLINGGPATNRIVTTYFRHTFNVADPGAYSALVVRLLRDDGGVVYLNGVEVFRSNIDPTGPISFTTLASNAVDEVSYFDSTNLSPALLVAGPNVLAVEIHQTLVTSSDTSFDAMLLGQAAGNQPPFITSQPQSQCVAAGQSVTFAVVALGNPVPAYQWKKNGVNIPGATSATFTIPAVSSGDAGNYTVEVSNSGGSVLSSVATLTVGLAMTNPSFEVDTFTVFPGYSGHPGNGPITGWTSPGGHGINPGSGFSPFTDNGAIPHGNQAAFLQEDGAMSQMVSGFTAGAQYYVEYYENARNCCGGQLPSLEVRIGGATIVAAHPIAPVGGANLYRRVVSSTFTASATSLELSFIKSNPQGGDTTAHFDNVCVVRIPLTASYTNTIFPGQNLIANQLDRGANTLNEVLPNVSDGSQVTKLDADTQTFHTHTYSSLEGGWIDDSSGTLSTATLGVYEAAFLFNPGSAYQLVFTGQERANVPPPPAIPPNGLVYRSGPINAPARYTDLTGTAPVEGALIIRWNAATQSYQTNRFVGGAWQPGEPVAAVGEGVALFISNPLSVTIVGSGGAVRCAGPGTILTANASGGTVPYSYSWTGPGGTSTGQTVSAPVAGTYTVTVTDANSATATTSVTLTAAPTVTISAAPGLALCGGQSTSLTANAAGGSAPYTYSWTGPGGITTAQTRTVAAVGTYTVTVTDANGCTATASATTITCPSVITLNCPANILLCTNDSGCGPMPDAQPLITASSTCAGLLTYSQSVAVGTTVCAANGPFNVVITASDACGNSTSCSVPFVFERCCVQPPANMVLWLTFDEPIGNTAFNSRGGNNGTLYDGAVPATAGTGPAHDFGGYVARSLNFDGVNDYVQVPAYSGINIGTSDFTVDAWVKPASLSSDIRVIVDHREQSSVTRGYSLFLGGNNGLAFQIADGVSFINYPSLVSVPADGRWHHVAVTVVRGSTTGIRFYLDGVWDGFGRDSVPFPGSLTPASAYPFRVGARSSSLSGFFPGGIDEVEVFCRALSAGEINSLWQARDKGKCKVSCHLDWDTFVCTNTTVNQSVTVQGKVKNDGPTPVTVNYSFAGIPPFGECALAGPTSFTPASGSVTIPPYSTVCVPTTALVPLLGPNQESCYLMTIQVPGTGEKFYCHGSFQGRTNICVTPSTGGGVLVTELNATNVARWQVANLGATPVVLPWQLVAYDPDMLEATNLGFPSGTSGTQTIAPNESVEIAVPFWFRNCNPGQFYDLVLFSGTQALSSVTLLQTQPGTGGEVPTNCFVFAGRMHCPLGTAQLVEGSNSLSVLNLGSSGEDGVEIALGETQGFLYALEMDEPLLPGAAFLSETRGRVNGAPDQPTSQSGFVSLETGLHILAPDFTRVGSSNYTLRLFLDGATVFSQSGLTGSPGTLLLDSKPKRCHYKPFKCTWTIGRLQDAAEFQLNDGRVVLADRMEMTADAPTRAVDFLSRVRLTAQQIGSFQIVEETLFNEPTVTSNPLDQTVTPGQSATFEVTAIGSGPLTYQWRLNGEILEGETQATLTVTNVHSRDAGVYDVLVSDRGFSVVSQGATLAVNFPLGVQVSLNPGGVLTVLGTAGSERIYLRLNPTNAALVQVVQVNGAGNPSSLQNFALASIQALEVDLGPGYDELVIGLVFGPTMQANLDTGADDGMLIADERGLPVPKRPDGIVDFPQLRPAFAPVLNLSQTQSNLLAQALVLRAQGTNLLLGGLDLVHLANSNLVNVAAVLGQQATNGLFPEATAVHSEATRLLGVANDYLAQAEALWPPPAEPSLESSNFIDTINAMVLQAAGYTNRLGTLSSNEVENLAVELRAADEASLDALLADIQGRFAAYETGADHFQQMIAAAYYGPALELEANVQRDVLSPAEMLAEVTAAALEARLEQFGAQAEALRLEAEGSVQSRADALNAAGDALQTLAAALEDNANTMARSLETFFANVPVANDEGFEAAGGFTGVNCNPNTQISLWGWNFLIGTWLRDKLTLTGPGIGFAAGLARNDRIIGTSGLDVLMGNAGNDSIRGRAGMDFIFGNAGNDCLRGEDGIDFIFGGDGDDEIQGGKDSDFLFGNDGMDIIEGNDGIDVVLGGNGPDMIFGNDGSDLLFGDGINATGVDTIEGGDGTVVTILGQTYHLGNLIFGQPDNDTCNGGKGIDLIFGNSGADTINGRDNIDVLFGNSGPDTMHGEKGGVLLTIVVNGVTIKIRFGNLMFGGTENDTMDAGSDLDLLFGNDHNDTMSGANGAHALVMPLNDLYFGGSGDDTIRGSRIGTDWIFGGADNDDAEGDDGNILAAPFFDFIFGNDGDDTLRGGHGMDLVLGNDGADVIQGGDGLLDLLLGNNGADRINGNDGFDLIFGGPSDDVINGDDNIDLCFGGRGNDSVNGNAGIDAVFGNLGDDLVDGGPGIDLCFGNDGNDRVRGGDDPDLVFGNDGQDACNGDNGFDLVFGNDDGDIVHGDAGPDLCFGGPGPDCVFGDADPDLLFGGADDDLVDGGGSFDLCFGNDGNDEVHGGTGNDLLFGNAGDDELYGEADADLLFGNDGRDKLFGGTGLDLVFGNDGVDVLNGEAGVDLLFGGADRDWIYGGPDADFAWGGDGNDVIFGGSGVDTLFGVDGDDCLDGGDQTDFIFCGDGNDTAYGRDGSDFIWGQSGDDKLDGGPGNDFLFGGPGSDDLYGGPGWDVMTSGSKHQSGNLGGSCPDAPCSQIYGGKWSDLNANGVRDAGEPWLAGVTIYLDLNGNGQLDFGEPSTVTTADNPATPKVDESGMYCFMGLPPGFYLVREIAPAGTMQSYPAGGAPHGVNLGLFATATGLDFGNKCGNSQPLKLLFILAQCRSNKLLLSFSAPLDPATASNPANYFIANYTIVAATLVNPQTVCLTVSSPFQPFFTGLKISNVRDQCGNVFNNGGNFIEFICATSKQIYVVPDGSGGLFVAWDPTQDVLECSTDLVNWTPVPGAASPYHVIPNGGQKYYRVRKL